MNTEKTTAERAGSAAAHAGELAERIKEAETLILHAGTAPTRISPEWTEQMTRANELLAGCAGELDGGGYEHSRLMELVSKAADGARGDLADYYDVHREHYIETLAKDLHFLVVNETGRVLAFENREDADNWNRYHHDRKASRTTDLDPNTVPSTRHGGARVRTIDLIEAAQMKQFLDGRSEQIRNYLRGKDEEEIQRAKAEAKAALERLTPEERQKIMQETEG